MPIPQSLLREASRRVTKRSASSLQEAKARKLRTVFLCHSHLDAELVSGLINVFAEIGWQVYVDWKDLEMPERPNAQTANLIKAKIKEHSYFMFLATRNSMDSKWCPWEIGYADGTKPLDTIFVCTTSDAARTYGNEYLELYRRVSVATDNSFRVWQPGQTQNGVELNAI